MDLRNETVRWTRPAGRTGPLMDRRSLLAAGAACAGLGGGGAAAGAPVAFLDDLAERTFRFFWETGDPKTGLAPDRWPSPAPCSIAAVGFALSAYTIGVERGWITREAARARTLAALRFFDRAPSGPGESGVSGHRGFFYHFLDMRSGLRAGGCELSTVDTALLHLGMVHAACWFDDGHPDEREIRRLADELVACADWPWFQNRAGVISMGWHPAQGFIARGWQGYNEGKMVYVLALGSAGHPVADGAWDRWTETYSAFWRGEGPSRRLAFGPLFGHQYSEMWIDFRGVRDAPMRAAGFDYAENSRRAALANRAYCRRNPGGWAGYGAGLWGLTACDGPGELAGDWGGATRIFHGYAARGPVDEPDGLDDGTLAPTAALGSLAFAPEAAMAAAQALRGYAGGGLLGRYGFVDSFNPSLRNVRAPVSAGRVHPLHGWIDGDHLGIDQGPILGAIANARDGSVWRAVRRSPVIRRGLARAGFTGGWLDAPRTS